ncbi:hypothetical protein ABMA27_014383 [Loxostege sticticalis]|uniref:PDZ domain-containing protein n=1 Tax=Loxostege sticticalis TaxID=481309 RepID=A0ABR3I8T2_LOXSC
MPPDNMAIDMRHSKLKPEEAALLAGELNKPSWESRNEGIHERVSFEDTIWGFDLAGGSYYKTPLRVTYVKPDSRAAKAGIRPGDKLKRINDIDTSTLTIQEAHEIIVESGIHLKLAVTAPEDEEDAYYCYQDPLDDGYDSEEERRREAERAKKRIVHARVSSYWSLQWPWVSKRRVIYRESNCFMVPSKYEGKHQEKFPPVPVLRYSDDVVLENMKNITLNDTAETLINNLSSVKDVNNENASGNGTQETIQNGPKEPITESTNERLTNGIEEPMTNGVEKSAQPNIDDDREFVANGDADKNENDNHQNGNLGNIPEDEEERNIESPEVSEDSIQEISEADSENIEEVKTTPVIPSPNELNGDVEPKDDEVIEDVLNGDTDVSEMEEEKIIDSILSESEDTVDER